jgi:glycosyltransferase involved in cell wall biosynthesis
MAISVIIPTYKEPEYLDLCIHSILSGQINNKNEVIVVVDGTYDINKHILEKYKSKIKPVIFDENYGLSKATNYGVYNSSYEPVLIVNDDNIFPKDWDSILLQDFTHNTVLSPNQIEPYHSMFKQFIQYDFGKTHDSFKYDYFAENEPSFRLNKITTEGSTLPFLIHKKNYLKLGGWDETYPSGHVVDWEFFLKCNLADLKLNRSYKCNFYHFVSIGTKSPEQIENTQKNEIAGFEYFKYKWGTYPKHDKTTNLKTT